MQKIIPCLWFDDKCEEAINFYISIFKDSKILSIQYYPEGLDDPHMQGMQGKILTAIFELVGQKFMALDGGPVFKPTPAVSFCVECEDQNEVDAYWDKLAVGGDPKMQQCGWVQDKYGFSWQIVPKILSKLLTDSDKTKSNNVMQAMLKMKKIDIAKLEEAYNLK